MSVIRRQLDLGKLDVGRQTQCHRAPEHGLCKRVGKRGSRRTGTGRNEALETGRGKHTGSIKFLVIGAKRINGSWAERCLAVDDQHLGPSPTGINRGMEAVRGGGAAADHGDAKATGRGRVSLGHGDRAVLVAGAVKADADSIKGRHEDGSIVAHQAEYSVDIGLPDILGERLIDGNHGAQPAAVKFLANR